jgi:hypothetical protein
MGDHLDRIHSDQNVLEVIRRGRLFLLIGGQGSQTSLRDHQAQVHSDQMVCVMARQESGPHKRRPTQGLLYLKQLKFRRELENNSGRPGNFNKTGRVIDLIRVNLLFLMGFMKRGVVADDDYDE